MLLLLISTKLELETEKILNKIVVIFYEMLHSSILVSIIRSKKHRISMKIKRKCVVGKFAMLSSIMQSTN